MKDKDKFQYLKANVISAPQIIPNVEVNGWLFWVTGHTDYEIGIVIRLLQLPIGVHSDYPLIQYALLYGNSVPGVGNEIKVLYSPSEKKYYYEAESYILENIDEECVLRSQN